ncbi:MAG: oligosaccharide flippase family protein [Elusimicrobiota bacterium]
MAVGLFLTYYVVKKIGLESYGVYVLITAAGGYLSMLDLGIGTSFVKYVAEFKALGLKKEINSLIGTGVSFYSIFGVFIFLLLLFFGGYIIDFFKISVNLRQEASEIILIYAAIMAFSGIFSPYQAVLTGLERFDISSKLSATASVLNLAGAIFFLEKGWGLRGLMINSLLIVLLVGITSVWLALGLMPEVKVNPFYFNRLMFSKIFGYGWKLQITRLSSVVSSHLEKIIITRFLSLSYVGFYQIGNSLCEQARSLPILLTGALFPAFSRLSASGNKADIRNAYYRASRYLAFATVGVMSFLSACSGIIIEIWMGKGYGPAAQVVSILSWGYLFNTVFGAVGASAVQGMGRTEIQMKGALLNMFLNAFLSAILIGLFGFSGAAIGTALPLTVSVIYFMYMLHPLLELENRSFFLNMGEIFLAGLSAFFVLLLFLKTAGLPDGRISALWQLTSSILIYSCVYFSSLFILKPFDSFDRSFFENSGLAPLKLMRIFCRDEKPV